MTDERIKEEYDVWISDGECTENERLFFSQYPAENHPTAAAFYAGFRTAERLAKIEAAENGIIFMQERLVPGVFTDIMLDEMRAAILGENVKEGKTDAEKLAIAVKALERIRDKNDKLLKVSKHHFCDYKDCAMSNYQISTNALKEIQ